MELLSVAVLYDGNHGGPVLRGNNAALRERAHLWRPGLARHVALGEDRPVALGYPGPSGGRWNLVLLLRVYVFGAEAATTTHRSVRLIAAWGPRTRARPNRLSDHDGERHRMVGIDSGVGGGCTLGSDAPSPGSRAGLD